MSQFITLIQNSVCFDNWARVKIDTLNNNSDLNTDQETSLRKYKKGYSRQSSMVKLQSSKSSLLEVEDKLNIIKLANPFRKPANQNSIKTLNSSP